MHTLPRWSCPDVAARGKINRNEKKVRKAVAKLNLLPVADIERVQVRKAQGTLFTIANPDVLVSPAGDAYVIFGEAKVEDPAAQLQAIMAEQARLAAGAGGDAAPAAKPADSAAVEEAEDTGDNGGFEAKDVDLVMQQANVNRAKAVEALKKTDGDLVGAIMELSM